MEENERTPINEDEISLIDLLVVLLRYRKMIIGLTLAALLLGGAYYFIVPQRQYEAALAEQKLQFELNLRATPTALQFGGTEELRSILQRPEVIYEALKEAGYDYVGYGCEAGSCRASLSAKEEYADALFLIRRRVLENKNLEGDPLNESQRMFEIASGKGFLTLTGWDKENGRMERFLQLLFHSARDSLKERLKQEALSIVESYDRLLAIEEPSAAVDSAVKQGTERYNAAHRVLQGEDALFRDPGGVLVMKPVLRMESFRSDIKTKALVAALAVLFFSVFLAFILNAAAQVKYDPESMAKIRRALGKE